MKKIRIIKEVELERLEYDDKKPKSKDKHIGIEIEFYTPSTRFELGQYLIQSGLNKYCQLKGDGSIYPPSSCDAFELAILCKESEVIKVIANVCKMLKFFKAKVNKTCGLHIHIDMRHRDHQLVFHNLVKAQPLLYAINPATRYSNCFCEPTKNSVLESYDDGGRSGINKHALSKHNTIEVRIHCGTTNRLKIINWIKLLLHIVEKDYQVDDIKTLSGFVKEFNVGKNLTAYLCERLNNFKVKRNELIEIKNSAVVL